MTVNKNSLKNLLPVKKGEKRAMKGSRPKKMRWSARIDNDNEEVATRLLAEHGSQTKVINYLLLCNKLTSCLLTTDKKKNAKASSSRTSDH